MIDADLLPHTITVITPTLTTDSYGNTVQSWATPAERQVIAYVRPAPASEDIVDRNTVTAVWQVHTNDQAITALNRIRHNGVVYEVDGRPLTWDKAPDGKTGHTKLLLRRVDG
jgi:head-tail adaptor